VLKIFKLLSQVKVAVKIQHFNIIYCCEECPSKVEENKHNNIVWTCCPVIFILSREQEHLLEVGSKMKKHPGGRSFHVISEAVAVLFALPQPEDVSAHKG